MFRYFLVKFVFKYLLKAFLLSVQLHLSNFYQHLIAQLLFLPVSRFKVRKIRRNLIDLVLYQESSLFFNPLSSKVLKIIEGQFNFIVNYKPKLCSDFIFDI